MFLRLAVAVAIASLVVALGAVQLASDALNAGAAAAGTLPRHVPIGFALGIYRALDRIAPAPYVEITLAQEALARGQSGAAERYAIRLPASPVRDELLARVARSRGEATLAGEYFLAAPDPAAVGASARALASRDPAAGYALEQSLEIRLARSGTHPGDVAQARWEMGRLANRQAWQQVPGSAPQRAWLVRASRDFETAVELAPLSERYVVEAANQADLLGDRRRAQALFMRAVAIDPASADGIAGLGVIAWQNGDRREAGRDLQRASLIDSHALMVRALARDLR